MESEDSQAKLEEILFETIGKLRYLVLSDSKTQSLQIEQKRQTVDKIQKAFPLLEEFKM